MQEAVVIPQAAASAAAEQSAGRGQYRWSGDNGTARHTSKVASRPILSEGSVRVGVDGFPLRATLRLLTKTRTCVTFNAVFLFLCGREYRRTSGTNTFHWHEHGTQRRRGLGRPSIIASARMAHPAIRRTAARSACAFVASSKAQTAPCGLRWRRRPHRADGGSAGDFCLLIFYSEICGYLAAFGKQQASNLRRRCSRAVTWSVFAPNLNRTKVDDRRGDGEDGLR